MQAGGRQHKKAEADVRGFLTPKGAARVQGAGSPTARPFQLAHRMHGGCSPTLPTLPYSNLKVTHQPQPYAHQNPKNLNLHRMTTLFRIYTTARMIARTWKATSTSLYVAASPPLLPARSLKAQP
eukprot:1177902-Prorocentrum_minimum.AAC.1